MIAKGLISRRIFRSIPFHQVQRRISFKFWSKTTIDPKSDSKDEHPNDQSNSGKGGDNGDDYSAQSIVYVVSPDEESLSQKKVPKSKGLKSNGFTENDFTIRMKSFSFKIMVKYYRGLLYIMYKAWIKEYIEYIALFALYLIL